MMRMRIAVLFCMLSVGGSAQLSVAVDALPDSIYFGDDITLNYKVNVPPNVQLRSLDFSPLLEIENAVYSQDTTMFDKIMDVDIVDGGVFEINNANTVVIGKDDRLLPLSGSVKIRISSVGIFALPIPKLGHMSSELEMPLQRKALYVLPRGQDIELNPNKPIILEPVKWTDYLPYLYALLAAAGLIAVGIYVNRRIQNKEAETDEFIPEVKKPAHEIAINDLNVLKSQELWQNGREKDYHSELTRIMRQYVEDRYDVPALEMTTTDLRRALSASGMEIAQTTTLIDILHIADKVKFAKGKTGPEINARFMVESVELVQRTKRVVIENTDGTDD